jgi:hypothetical protein
LVRNKRQLWKRNRAQNARHAITPPATDGV